MAGLAFRVCGPRHAIMVCGNGGIMGCIYGTRGENRVEINKTPQLPPTLPPNYNPHNLD